jgi:multicomponent Na+:H+ antiporter subunit E
MKLFYKFFILSLAATGIFATYNKFAIDAHWLVLFFWGIISFFWLSSFVYSRKSFYQMLYLGELTLFFIKEMFLASFQVAYEVITPKSYAVAGLVALPLDVKSNLEITVLSSLISLTPGTLSVDVSEDRSLLFVHAMFIPHGDVEIIKQELKLGFERRVYRIFN